MEIDPTCLEGCEYESCLGRDRHHLYYPEKDYQEGIDKRFRSMSDHIVNICIRKHREIHATQDPPIKPSKKEMKRILNGNT